ncbi:MAG TPA: HAD family hydrolase [Candidatus Saccharimonadales bacterium]|jgi:D-glycero-D-manno-heptose 1,7-bisphosphate phosphatase|nr:HAD family hydrolase [Candidatus Saccharimonadales bacterium]
MKAVFLDRDGTIIVDPPDERVDTEEKIQLFPQTIEALKLLASLDYGVIIITNQAGIAEGRITEADFQRIDDKVLEMLQPSGITILKTYVCPHGPDDSCDCRKPKPTMILQAAKDFDVELTQSWMIGDNQSDIMAGVNAGTKTVLVKTANKPVESPEADYTAINLLEAIQYIATGLYKDLHNIY